MPQKIRHIVQSLLLGLCIVSVLACTHIVMRSRSQTDAIAHSPPRRVVQHILGEMAVPMHPQRVVTPSPCTLETALALGVKPVGGSHWNWRQPYLQGKVEGIEDIGWIPDINLERIVALEPDLILGTNYHTSVYGLLSEIAPTFLADERPGGSGDWRVLLTQMAEALGEVDVAEQVIQAYTTRIDRLKAQMSDRLQGAKISVIAIYQGQLNVYTESDFSGTILRDVELSRPPLQSSDSDLLHQSRFSLSEESLSELDGDIIFLVRNDAREPDRQGKLNQLKARPLWKKLNAVQQGQIYEVSDYWLGCSPLAANAVVDDLFKYLVNTH